MKSLIVHLFLLIPFFLIAGNDNFPIGGRSVGMGNASVTFRDVWAGHHNQAGLAALENISLGFHHENRFIVKEYSYQSFVFAVPTSSGTFGLDLSYFGYTKYNEAKIGISYSRKLFDRLHVGVQLDYFNNYIAENYGNTGNVAAEIGVLAEPIDDLFIGAHILNLTQSKLASYNEERIPTILRVGIGYRFSEKLIISGETEKDIDFDPVYKVGVEYMAIENLYFRTGIMTNPVQNTFGIGYEMRNFKADIAFSTHNVLGITPHISLCYTFNRKKEINEID